MNKIELEVRVKELESENNKLKLTILLLEELLNAGMVMKKIPDKLGGILPNMKKERRDSGLSVDPKVKTMVDEVLTEIEENIKGLNNDNK